MWQSMGRKHSFLCQKNYLFFKKKAIFATNMEDIGVYINLFTDFGFKKIFGTDSNKDLLIHFLNTVLENEINPITELEFANGEFLGRRAKDRKAIVDVFCKTKKGERFIIELQRAEQDFFKDRSLFYATFPIQEQAKKGNWNFELLPVYTVCIMDFVFNESEQDKVITCVQLREKGKDEPFLDKLTFVYVEMPKFLKDEHELETVLDKWLYFFKHLHEFKDLPATAQEGIFQKLFQESKILNYSPKEAMKYKESWKSYNDYYNTIEFAKFKAVKEAVTEAMKEANIAHEKQQKEKMIQIAKSVLAENALSIEKIAEITGLSVDEIKQLQS
jgi:predicted transposase/invertase (TIGR01784 family)